MILNETNLNIVDNSGVKIIKCIKVLGGSKRKAAKIGEIIIGAIQKRDYTKTLIKSKIYPTVILATRKKYKRKNGFFLKFDDNTGVLLSKENLTLFASRLFSPIVSELKKSQHDFLKIISLSKKIL